MHGRGQGDSGGAQAHESRVRARRKRDIDLTKLDTVHPGDVTVPYVFDL